MNGRHDLLSEARRRLPLPALMALLGYGDRAKKSAGCPFHRDRRPSFTVTQRPNGRWRFRCFGCGASGDEITFVEIAKGLPNRDAAREFIRMAGVEPISASGGVPGSKAWPTMRPGRPEELTTLARTRNLSVEGLNLASDRGLLRFGRHHGQPVWFVVDSVGPVAQARRLDGQPWGNGTKALTLPGSRAAWPVGASGMADFPVVLLTEGGPDLLAAHHFFELEGRASDTCAVGMLGAGLSVAREAVPAFAGKRIRFFTHTDEAGHRSVGRWAAQLAPVAGMIDALDMSGLRRTDGSPVGDLNDLTSVDPDDFDAHPELRALVPTT